MWCHVMWCSVMSCEVMWRDATGWDAMRLWGRAYVLGWLWGHVRWCEFGDDALMRARKAHVTKKALRHAFRCVVRPWDANHNKTTNSHCHSKNPRDVMLRTTEYYDALESTTMFPHNITHKRTTKYFSVRHSSTPYKKLLHNTVLHSARELPTQYCSVLTSTTPY